MQAVCSGCITSLSCWWFQTLEDVRGECKPGTTLSALYRMAGQFSHGTDAQCRISFAVQVGPGVRDVSEGDWVRVTPLHSLHLFCFVGPDVVWAPLDGCCRYA